MVHTIYIMEQTLLDYGQCLKIKHVNISAAKYRNIYM